MGYDEIGGVKMKVQMSLNDELVQRLDKYAKENYLSRSSVMSIAVNQYLNSADIVSYIRDMDLAMRKIAETGKVSKEDLAQLQDFEKVAKVFIPSK